MKQRTAYETLPMLMLELERYFYFPSFIFHYIRSASKKFVFNGSEYSYFLNPYNRTWVNERAVEIPLALSLLTQHEPHKTLEVGNVLSHYKKSRHTIVDKYERRKGVLNADVVDMAEDPKYSLILCVSTLEHIGWDESPRQPGKYRNALQKMSNLLEPGGQMLVTVPIGYNSDLDRDLFSGSLIGKMDFLLRLSTTSWRQASATEVVNCKYGSPYRAANAVAILSYTCP